MGDIIIAIVLMVIALFCGALTGFGSIFISFLIGAALCGVYYLIKYLIVKNNNNNQSSNDNEVVNQATNDVAPSQQNLEEQPMNNQRANLSLDELETLKKLLDEDIITKEEFEAKKKQILGL